MTAKFPREFTVIHGSRAAAGVRRLPMARDGMADGISPIQPKAPTAIPSRKPLTDRVVDRAKWTPDGKDKLFDGKGLYLFLTPAGGKIWRADYRLDGKRRTIAYGAYDAVSLADARELHKAARKLIAAGVDPVHARKAERLARRSQDTVKALANEWLTKRTIAAATRKKAALYLRVHIEPALGRLKIGAVTAPLVLEVLRPIEERGQLETAHRVKQIVGQLLRYAVATGRAARDVTVDLKGALSTKRTENYAAPTKPDEVAQLLRAVDSYDGSPVVSVLLRLAPLVLLRPGEIRLAEWTDIDWKAKTLDIPASKMKMRAGHRVPLSTQAIALLREVQRISGRVRYVFPSPRDPKRPLSNMTHGAALRALGYTAKQITPHGFRAMARTLMDEQLRIDRDVIELQLAHTVPGTLGSTYNRSLHIEARRTALQQYADYLDTLKGA